MKRVGLSLLISWAGASCGGSHATVASAAPGRSDGWMIAHASSAAPSASPAPAPSRPIDLVEARDEASPLVTFRVLFSSGSADDPAGREGSTYLAATLMTEGGTEALTYEELTRQLFPMAAQISVHVDRDMTVFVAQVHRDQVAAFYPLFRDVLLHPRLGDDDFRRVRTQTRSALTQELRGADDERLGREYLQSMIYAGHPYGHPVLGTEGGLDATTVADVRTQRARTFCRDRVRVGLAGGYPAGLADQMRADLASLPGQCPEAQQLAPPAALHGMHVVIIDKPGASATAISVGFPVEIGRTDYAFPALTFATDYLGLHRQSSGVLYQTLREARGLNYGDFAYDEHFEQEPSSRFPMPNIQRRQQYASLWLRPLRPSTAHFALRGALRALTRLRDNPISQADVDRTRTFLSGYLRLYTQTASERLGYALDDAWHWGDAAHEPFLDGLRTAWRAITPADVQAAARRYLTADDVWVVIVAPNARELASALAHNTPSPMTYDSPKPAWVLAEDREIEAFHLPVQPDHVTIVPVADVFR